LQIFVSILFIIGRDIPLSFDIFPASKSSEKYLIISQNFFFEIRKRIQYFS